MPIAQSGFCGQVLHLDRNVFTAWAGSRCFLWRHNNDSLRRPRLNPQNLRIRYVVKRAVQVSFLNYLAGPNVTSGVPVRGERERQSKKDDGNGEEAVEKEDGRERGKRRESVNSLRFRCAIFSSLRIPSLMHTEIEVVQS